MTVPADEGRHRPGSDAGWQEAWELDLVSGDGSLAAELALVVRPAAGASTCRVSLVGDDRRLVTVVEHGAPLPGGRALGLRAEGLWLDLVCETPLEHWTVGLEAFGVALDEPLEALSGCRGDVTAVGFDLEWETSGAARAAPVGDGYELPCSVSGELLVGPEVIDLTATGWRRHTWGVPSPGAPRAWGHGGRAGPWVGPATVVWGDDGLPDAASVEAAGTLALTPRHHAPALDAEGGRTGRTLCDSARGPAWLSW